LPESGHVPRAPRRHEQRVVDVYRVIAIVAKRSPVDADARHPLVAIGIVPVTAKPAIPFAWKRS
jgi:hypothetical protein